jgi:hypothetical protein
MNLRCLAIIILCTLSAVSNLAATATTLKDLYQADKLRIKAWIEPRENIIARQQVNLQIEIATDKWFSGGTRFGPFEIKDAILLQRENFALNSSRKEDNASWTVQQWTLVIYPQRGGVFEIPTIPVHLSIAGDNLESIVGELQTEPFSFTAGLPEPMFQGMLEKTSWIVTSHFTINESFDKSFDDLKPGDAIVRSISMSAINLPAMMLPGITLDNLPGIAVYPKPPQLADKVNRGSYLAARSQIITYVFEKPGDYELAKQTFYWWNLETDTFETIDLEARVMKVHDSAEIAEGSNLEPTADWQQMITGLIPVLTKTGVALMLVALGWVVFRKLSKISTRTNQSDKLSERALRKQFETACRKNNLQYALALFYQWLDNYGGKAFEGSVVGTLNEIDQTQLTEAFRNIMRTMYTPDRNKEIDLRLFANRFISELQKLDRPGRSSLFSVELKLN